MLENRLRRVRERMAMNGLSQIIVTQPQAIYYLTGEWVEPHDRLDALVVTQAACRMLCYVLAVINPEGCDVTVYSDTGAPRRRFRIFWRTLIRAWTATSPAGFCFR